MHAVHHVEYEHYILDQTVARDKARTLIIVVAGMCGEKKARDVLTVLLSDRTSTSTYLEC